jgi:hypothetical protein
MILNDTTQKSDQKRKIYNDRIIEQDIKRFKTNVFMMIVLTIILAFLAANIFKTPLLANTAMCFW